MNHTKPISQLLEWSYETIQAVADAELEKWGLVEKGWVHVFEDHPGGWVGQSRNGPKMIVSNCHYIDNGMVPKEIVDTIRHEIAHALDGYTRYSRPDWRGVRKAMNHDTVWRKIAVKVGATPRARTRLEGYIKPSYMISASKWMMVFVNGEDLEEIRPVKRFIAMVGRYITSRPESSGNLYLVLTDKWNKYKAGILDIENLEFWQNNPNCPVWGRGKPKKIYK